MRKIRQKEIKPLSQSHTTSMCKVEGLLVGASVQRWSRNHQIMLSLRCIHVLPVLIFGESL